MLDSILYQTLSRTPVSNALQTPDPSFRTSALDIYKNPASCRNISLAKLLLLSLKRNVLNMLCEWTLCNSWFNISLLHSTWTVTSPVPYLTHQIVLPNECVTAGCGSVGWQLCGLFFCFNKPSSNSLFSASSSSWIKQRARLTLSDAKLPLSPKIIWKSSGDKANIGVYLTPDQIFIPNLILQQSNNL